MIFSFWPLCNSSCARFTSASHRFKDISIWTWSATSWSASTPVTSKSFRVSSALRSLLSIWAFALSVMARSLKLSSFKSKILHFHFVVRFPTSHARFRVTANTSFCNLQLTNDWFQLGDDPQPWPFRKGSIHDFANPYTLPLICRSAFWYGLAARKSVCKCRFLFLFALVRVPLCFQEPPCRSISAQILISFLKKWLEFRIATVHLKPAKIVSISLTLAFQDYRHTSSK